MRRYFHFILLQQFIFNLFLDPPISSIGISEDTESYHGIYGHSRNARGVPYPPRWPLPHKIYSDLFNFVSCGSYSSIAVFGPAFFNFNSPDKECGLAFIGSRAQNCTVAIICKDEINLEPADNCIDGYATFWDGTYGMMNACGTFSFHGVPRFPRNGGTDIYVKYKAKANSGSICGAFCKEELTDAHYKESQLKTPKRLKKSSLYEIPKKEKDCTCGKKSEQTGRIVGGSDMTPFEFPWLVVIVLKTESFNRKPHCGAALISNRYVLTGAHCVDDDHTDFNRVQVILHAHAMDLSPKPGDTGTENKYHEVPGYDLPTTTDADEGSLRLEVAKLIIHPLFEGYKYDYDIALLELAEPVDILHKNFTPICLPDMEELVKYPDNAMFTVAGWGLHHQNASSYSRIPKKVDVQLGTCMEEWERGTPRHICAGYLEGVRDACDGDSGSPLMYKFRPETDQYMVSGTVSDGLGCAQPDLLGWYTNVQELLLWIYLKMDAPDNKFCST